jgi:hypothetical protein
MDGAARLRFLQFLQAFLQAVRCRRTWHVTDRLLVLLGAIADPELRLHRFAEHLKARTAEEAAWTIAELWDRVAAGERAAQTICLGLLDAKRLARVLEADHLKGAQAVLEANGHVSAGLFSPAKPRRDPQDDEAVPRPKEPVGFRISLARQPVARALDRLLFDPDARVVRTILGNPRLTEAEVVKLAASRRAPPEVLEVIAQDDRWIARYPVKVALANNPTTPLRVVLGLLPYLLHQDLRAVAAGSSRAAVREQASSLLSRRPGA